ncbi:FimV/HubP family polar landmark protein [Pseudomonas fluorescens]|uniref:LysM peptidoglycan-binding domain-containing protein n=1 Tax=Pseudomonas fluorescens TaxID=294 RepID=A0A944DQX6_PSEFL|nr:FimV/HubP family polar landmark protein [Pseudomonas fluorescens]MBT2294202.1 LysM peptidoglycan-binding domain-containing protein [Pseudomonas fluorescens]MBT2307141.1 LysM peptidoglycan-binding domain-containing protein [Pseudomonas fluorescens]MBT2315948.1 LysM peptidoglycan-binding domain-containing protein [Pseudomonas fluorescens]MBT2331114.1 LysM peptidoglycan-binding domain-containing protein [Pseudomonas fluorescens]MBT2345812.1 LysM peptidoglycan-binding domain-containing protein 
MLVSLQSTLRSWVNVLVVVAAMGYPAFASALGLGEITLHSALNQPLRADIALVDVAGVSESDLSASLASPDDFSRAGVERVFFLNSLRFTPVLRGARSYIRVTSSKPVEEPFLNFLVQLNQPNGRLLREYTVLIDPPGTPGIVPARDEPSAAAQATPAIKPPAATQGKRYTVVQGDNPWAIAKRLHDAGSNASVNELMQGIQALNPGSERLSVGQRLLLPDSAVLPSSVETAAAPAAESDEQLAASVLQNEQQQKTIEQLQALLQAQDEEIAGQREQISQLQTQLAEVTPAPAASAQPESVPAASLAPAEQAQAVTEPVPEAEEGINWLWMTALVGLLGLLGLLLFLRRRQQEQDEMAPIPQRAEQALEDDSPTYASTADTEQPEAATSFSNGDAPLGDVLEGVGIYLTYGRFTEAAGLLRAALLTEPARTDLGLKLLEVLGKQGDTIGFQAQEHHLLAQGVDVRTLEEIRGRYPKVAAVAAPVVAEPQPPAPLPDATPVPRDEFELNLDALSMETSWDLAEPQVSATEKTPVAPDGFGDLSLSGFDEPDLQWNAPSETESLDDAFLDGFADEEQSLELEPMALEPVSYAPQVAEHSDKLEQAQNCIDDGDLKTAVALLEQLLEEGNEPLKQTARVLLAGIR